MKIKIACTNEKDTIAITNILTKRLASPITQ